MTDTKIQKPVVKVLIVGLGGVGGFYGGLLAKQFAEDESVNICFLARGENLKVIQEHGLRVNSKDYNFISKPGLITSNVEEIGVVDYIVLSTKDYDLQNTVLQIAPCIGKNTVLLPLLNGVKAFESLQVAYSENEVWKGCTYIVSRLIAPGVIENKSGRQRLVFGLDSGVTDRMRQFETMLKDSGIKAEATNSITTEIWEKYILVSTSASATTYFNASIGEVMSTYFETTQELLKEATSLARAKGVVLGSDIIELITDRLRAIPGDSTTSMHTDFLAGKASTELNIMTGYIVEQAETFGLDLPTYSKIFYSLQNRGGDAYFK